MKANTDKNLENFTEKIMKETSLETTSIDFTANVMAKVLAADRVVVYKPLISKPVWFVIFAGVCSLAGYVIIHTQPTGESWLGNVDFDKINYSFLNSFASLKISAISFYTIVLATVMLLIQLTFLNSHFNKRFKTH